jgi:hypothetical protein
VRGVGVRVCLPFSSDPSVCTCTIYYTLDRWQHCTWYEQGSAPRLCNVHVRTCDAIAATSMLWYCTRTSSNTPADRPVAGQEVKTTTMHAMPARWRADRHGPTHDDDRDNNIIVRCTPKGSFHQLMSNTCWFSMVSSCRCRWLGASVKYSLPATKPRLLELS